MMITSAQLDSNATLIFVPVPTPKAGLSRKTESCAGPVCHTNCHAIVLRRTSSSEDERHYGRMAHSTGQLNRQILLTIIGDQD